MRKDTVSWNDGKVLTKLMCELQQELMGWQMHAHDVQFRGKKVLGGDQSVLIGCIRLRNKLEEVIDRSRKANSNETR